MKIPYPFTIHENSLPIYNPPKIKKGSQFRIHHKSKYLTYLESTTNQNAFHIYDPPKMKIAYPLTIHQK